MTTFVRLSFNAQTAKATVGFTQEWEGAEYLLRRDALQDWINQLQEEYDRIGEEDRLLWEKRKTNTL